MERRFRKVFENEDEIELLQCKLDSFQGCNFDLVERDNKERRFNEVDETFSGRLQPGVGSERNTLKGQLSEGHVNLDRFSGLCTIVRVRAGETARLSTYRSGGSLRDSLRKELKLLVEHLSPSPFLLFHLYLILVTITVFPLSVTRLIELNVGSFSEELNVLDHSQWGWEMDGVASPTHMCLLLSNNDWGLQVNMNDHEQLLVTRLEEQMLDI